MGHAKADVVQDRIQIGRIYFNVRQGGKGGPSSIYISDGHRRTLDEWNRYGPFSKERHAAITSLIQECMFVERDNAELINILDLIPVYFFLPAFSPE
jgi:hypothetical protein